MTALVHMLRDRKGKIATTRCRATVKPSETTIWETDVTCPDCVWHPPSEPTEASEASEASVAPNRRRVIPRYAPTWTSNAGPVLHQHIDAATTWTV